MLITPAAMLVLVVGALVCGLVGYLIGKSKGRPGAGFALGFFLGFLGWIITAVVPKTQQRKEAEAVERVRLEELARQRLYGDESRLGQLRD
jgi:predicted MFS family arabinose efflux permease